MALEVDVYGRISGYGWGLGLLTVLIITPPLPLTDRFGRKNLAEEEKQTQKHKKHRDGGTNNVNTAIEDIYTKTQKHTKHEQWHWNKNKRKTRKHIKHMTKFKITKKNNPKPHDTTDEVKGKLSYWGRKSQENTKTHKTLVGIHYLGPKIKTQKYTKYKQHIWSFSDL